MAGTHVMDEMRYDVAVAGGGQARQEVAAYLERYAEQFELPVELSTPVRSLSKDADGFVLDANGSTIRADAVAVATGLPGLYFLGLPWQHTRGSALLGFVAYDAAFIAGHLDGDVEPSAGRSTDPVPQAAGATEGAF